MLIHCPFGTECVRGESHHDELHDDGPPAVASIIREAKVQSQQLDVVGPGGRGRQTPLHLVPHFR